MNSLMPTSFPVFTSVSVARGGSKTGIAGSELSFYCILCGDFFKPLLKCFEQISILKGSVLWFVQTSLILLRVFLFEFAFASKRESSAGVCLEQSGERRVRTPFPRGSLGRAVPL